MVEKRRNNRTIFFKDIEVKRGSFSLGQNGNSNYDFDLSEYKYYSFRVVYKQHSKSLEFLLNKESPKNEDWFETDMLKLKKTGENKLRIEGKQNKGLIFHVLAHNEKINSEIFNKKFN